MFKDFWKLVRESYKSLDTEENIDIYFTRPIGMFFALIWKALGVHPNVVTIISLFLGAGAGWMFYHTDLASNICGVILLLFANFCDSTDGQLARMTGQKTLIGRMLDGAASDVWFACIYVALALRLMPQNIPGTDVQWGVWIWVLCASAGIYGHARQCRLADYYRNIHLFFLFGKKGSELDSYESQKTVADNHRKERNWIGVLFFANYAKYCKAQEAVTPAFQQLRAKLIERYGSMDNVPHEFRNEFRRGSLPLMKYTNFLTHNWRAFTVFASCLLDCPWVYPVVELTIMQLAYVYMHRRHESLCRNLELSL